MNGPEHYKQAEELLVRIGPRKPEDPDVAPLLAAAQVHATLALAAATAESGTTAGQRAVGVRYPTPSRWDSTTNPSREQEK